MAVIDIATRTYDHGLRLETIVRSLLDTDFNKLLMLQMIRQLYPDVRATFGLINRTKTVRWPTRSTRASCAPSSIMPAPSASPRGN